MIDPRQITPLLTNTTVDKKLAKGPNGDVYLVTRRVDNKKLALKHLSIPASDSETQALIYSGAVKSESQAQRYYESKVKDLKAELLLINNIKNAGNLLKFRGYQVDQKFIGSGYDVYLLSDYCENLSDYIAAHPLTKLEALNLAIDLCSALEQLRGAGLVHMDIHPRNIFRGSSGHFMLGDLGVAQISELQYSSIPDSKITEYTAPEVTGGNASLSETMDVYSVGVVLYEIYNGGQLPRNSEGKFKRKPSKPLPEPEYADVALSEIILKACEFVPDSRYQSPSEMKQALSLYLQRGGATNEYLVPQPEKAPEPVAETPAESAPVDADAIAAAVIAAEDAQAVDLTDVSEIISADAAVLREEEKVPTRSLNDLGEDELLLPCNEEITLEEFMANLRKNTGIEVMSMDSAGNMTEVPGYETEASLPEDTEFVESADNRMPILSDLQEIEQSEAASTDAPVSDPSIEEAADTIAAAVQGLTEDKLPEQSFVDIPAEDTPDEAPDEIPEEAPVARPARRRGQRRPEAAPAYDDSYESGEESFDNEDEDEDEGGSVWKKVLIAVIVLLVLAGGSFTFYTFKTDTVNTVESQVMSSTSVVITTETKNSSALEVVCSTPTGEVSRVPYTQTGAVFTDLNPNTTYTFTLASTDGKVLLGTKTTEAKTREMTNLNGFAASSVSAVSATLALSGTGPVPDSWVVTLTSAAGENITAESAEIPIVVEGLTPETTYTATIARKDGDLLGGTTECTFSTMEYTTLATFDTTAVTTSNVSLAWTYAGTVPDCWTVTCTGSDGTVTSQDVNGTECVLDGLVSGETYTITLSCPSLKATELSTLEIMIPSVTITELTSTANEDGDVEVEWEYTSDIEPKTWTVSYAYIDSTGNATSPTTVVCDEPKATLTGLLPDTTYQISVVGADDFTVDGTMETTCLTAEAETFTDYGCSDPELTLYAREENPEKLEDSTTTFTTQQHVSFALEVSYDVSEEDKSVNSTYVIRDAEGNPVKVYVGEKARQWSGTYTVMRHTGDIPAEFEVPGEYTLEIYFNNQFVASADFTVTE